MRKLTPLVDRSTSIVTGKADHLESLFLLANAPVFMGCVDQSADDDLCADMDWQIDSENGMIQLAKLIPLETLYLNQHNDGVGKIWHDLYRDFAEFIKEHNQGQTILEIGGAHDEIAKQVMVNNDQISWTIVEPNPENIVNDKIRVIKGWFDEDFRLDTSVDTIVHSHVLEHTYNPREFIEQIGNFLKTGSRHIFALPNMLPMLENKFTNCLNFEHTFFITEHFVDYFLARNGFKIITKQYFGDPHSIFYATEKIDTKDESIKLENKYEEYKKVFLDFVDWHKNIVQDLNQRMLQAEELIYLFGAHIFSQYLITFGLNTDKIISILDNSQMKQGKRLYGTKFTVKSPQSLKDLGKVNVILKAGIYNEEIKKDILENINAEVTFW